jgi:hypothetical protein
MRGEKVAVVTVIPKSIRSLGSGTLFWLHWGQHCSPGFIVFVIEALHPDGWRQQGRTQVEYWAHQEAQARCCSDGRNYRIVDEQSRQIVAFVDTSSCGAFLASR